MLALTTSLRYDISSTKSLRIAYTFAHSVITQTGEMGCVNADGSAADVYPIDNPVVDANGNLIEKRDTQSIAMLNQISGEYRGRFLDDKLTATIGARAPFLRRELTNYCFTRNASATSYAAAFPYVATGALPTGSAAPQTRTYNYSAVLPNIGLVYKMPGAGEIFFNYSMGFSAPQTTALYQSFYFPQGTAGAQPGPEKTNNFDLGYRYNDHRLLAQFDLWYTHFANRLGSAYNPTEQTSVYSNLGTVIRYGIDGSIAYRFSPEVTGYVFGSWLHSKIQDNVDNGLCTSANATAIAVGQAA